jgi:DNA-binding HxlR family transcriptional regulator
VSIAKRTFAPEVSEEAWDHGRRLLELVGTRWASLLICALSSGPKGYGELHRKLDGISRKMLTDTLRKLEADGLVTRRTVESRPPRVYYSLTPLGDSLVEPLAEVFRWSEAHIGELHATGTGRQN